MLIGMRGSGKSTVGRLVAEHLKMRLIEMDELIMRRLGMSIADSVAKGGWQGFRDAEAALCREVAAMDNTVNATGGGVVLRAENVRELRRNGRLFWLRIDLDTIIERIANDPARPSLTGKPFREDMAQVLAERDPVYRGAADFIIEADGRTPEAIADEIIEIWRRESGGQG